MEIALWIVGGALLAYAAIFLTLRRLFPPDR